MQDFIILGDNSMYRIVTSFIRCYCIWGPLSARIIFSFKGIFACVRLPILSVSKGLNCFLWNRRGIRRGASV